MPTLGECAAPQETAERPLEAYRAAADGLRHCLTMADMAAQRGNACRAAEYLLGALEDLAPELTALRSVCPPK